MHPQNTPEYRVYVGKTDNDYKSEILKGLTFIRWENIVKKNTRVFVKPNLTLTGYREGITTTPALIQSLLELLKSRTDKIILGESDGGNHSFTADESLAGHDMPRICRELGVEAVNLSKLPSVTVAEEILGKKVQVRLPKLLLEDVDCVVSIPVLKVHVMTGISLSIKNLWGCHPDTMRCLEHQDLGYKLALITKKLKPGIVVIDGTYGLDGHGPLYGEAKKMGMLVVADNAVAADTVGAALMGVPLKMVKHIGIAGKAGLGTTELSSIKISEGWEKQKKQFSMKKTIIDRMTRLLFNNNAIARLVMTSPLTPVIYRLAALLRTKNEKELADQMGKKVIGPY
jgi:uncharacterized protein (DUF362 family)